jgi:hypothetical protein
MNLLVLCFQAVRITEWQFSYFTFTTINSDNKRYYVHSNNVRYSQYVTKCHDIN